MPAPAIAKTETAPPPDYQAVIAAHRATLSEIDAVEAAFQFATGVFNPRQPPKSEQHKGVWERMRQRASTHFDICRLPRARKLEIKLRDLRESIEDTQDAVTLAHEDARRALATKQNQAKKTFRARHRKLARKVAVAVQGLSDVEREIRQLEDDIFHASGVRTAPDDLMLASLQTQFGVVNEPGSIANRWSRRMAEKGIL